MCASSSATEFKFEFIESSSSQVLKNSIRLYFYLLVETKILLSSIVSSTRTQKSYTRITGLHRWLQMFVFI